MGSMGDITFYNIRTVLVLVLRCVHVCMYVHMYVLTLTFIDKIHVLRRYLRYALCTSGSKYCYNILY